MIGFWKIETYHEPMTLKTTFNYKQALDKHYLTLGLGYQQRQKGEEA